MRISTLTGSLLAIAALGACSSDSTTAPVNTPAVTDVDAAMVAGDATAQDVELMHGPGGGSFGMGLFAGVLQFGCNQSFQTPLTVDVTCTFTDGSGTEQTDYDPATTASVHMVATLQGSIDRGHFSGSIDRSVDLTVSGLDGTETTRTWNGTCHSARTQMIATSDGDTRTFEMEADCTITDVVVPAPRSDDGWPLSGTIERHLTITLADGTTITRDATITFNGTQTVTITLNGKTFDFDLVARSRPHLHEG